MAARLFVVARFRSAAPAARCLSSLSTLRSALVLPGSGSCFCPTAAAAGRHHAGSRPALAALRHSSTSTIPATGNEEEKVVLYEGPLRKVMARLKMISLTSCTLTVIFVPLSIFAGNPSMPLASKVAVATTVGFFGMLTTGLLHRVSKSYVCALSINKADAALFEHSESSHTPTDAAGATPVPAQPMQDADVTVTVETLNIFGKRKTLSFPASKITYPSAPGAFVTFYVNGQPFFVHPELVRADGRLLGIFRGMIENKGASKRI